MAPTLKLAECDLSQFVLWGDRSHDFGQPLSPQFGGNTAFNDGQPWTRTSAGNREWGFPLLLQPRNGAYTNLIVNPSFEVDTTGWATTGSNSTIARTTSQALTASASLQVTVTPATLNSGGQYSGATPAAVASTVYRVSVWVLGAAGGEALEVIFGNSALSDYVSVPFTGSTSWQEVTATYTCVTPAAGLALQVRTRTNSTATYYIDKTMMVVGALPPSYFDGDQLDANWSGTAHASTSLTLTGTDGLHQMVRDLNGRLCQGVSVQFKPEGATNISYFDLEKGILDPHWDLYEDNAGVLKAGLHLYTRPYATTGTTRLVASLTGSGPTILRATGILGDTTAFGNLFVQPPSALASTPLMAWGLYSSPSMLPIRLASTHLVDSGGGTLTGATTAVGSQTLRWIKGGLGGNTLSFRDSPSPVAAFTGRHRLFLVARHQYSVPTAVTVQIQRLVGPQLLVGGPVSASVYVNGGGASAWQLVDMGEVTFDAGATGRDDPPQTAINFTVNVASGQATAAVDFNAAIYLPLGINAGVVMPATTTSAQASGLVAEYYPRVRSAMGNASQTYWAADMRGGPPVLPPVASSGSPSSVSMVVLAGEPGNYLGNGAVTVRVEARERFTYLA